MRVDHKRIEELSSAIVDQLGVIYPNGIISEDEMEDLQNNLDNLLNRTTDSRLDFSFVEREELENSISIALQEWNSRTQLSQSRPPTSGTSMSISLFDQFQGGFALPVTLEEIIEASSVKDQLAVFKKITYVDDLLSHWMEILPVLKTCLQTNDDSDAMEFVKLHRKWFDQARSSAEYLGLQCDLCENLLDATFNAISNSEADAVESDRLVNFIWNWQDMFLDMMQLGHYSGNAMSEMEARMLFFLRSISLSHSSQHEIHSPARILALIDPETKWFRSWAAQVSPIHMSSLLEKAGVVPELIRRCRMDTTSISNETNVVNRSLRFQSIVILASILNTTRVAHFPWHQLSLPSVPLARDEFTTKAVTNIEDSTNQEPPRWEDIDPLIDIFRLALAEQNIFGEVEWIELMCCNSIEIIFMGCHTVGLKTLDILPVIQGLLSDLQKVPRKQTVALHLQRVLTQLP